MNMQKLSLREGLQELEKGNNEFYLEVDLLGIEERGITQHGNIFVRVNVKDEETIATLVVWGSSENKHNVEVVEREPEKIRILRPVRPSHWARTGYKVDLWAHERVTRIEEI